MFPDLDWRRAKNGVNIDGLTNSNEHMADAIGALNAAFHDDEFMSMISLMKSMKRG